MMGVADNLIHNAMLFEGIDEKCKFLGSSAKDSNPVDPEWDPRMWI
jgi:hypothetical protein